MINDKSNVIKIIVEIIIRPMLMMLKSPLTVSLNIKFIFKKGIIEYKGVVFKFIKYEIRPGIPNSRKTTTDAFYEALRVLGYSGSRSK